MFYVIEQNNDLLVLKQWKCALNYPTLRARSVFLQRLRRSGLLFHTCIQNNSRLTRTKAQSRIFGVESKALQISLQLIHGSGSKFLRFNEHNYTSYPFFQQHAWVFQELYTCNSVFSISSGRRKKAINEVTFPKYNRPLDYSTFLLYQRPSFLVRNTCNSRELL